MMNMCLLNSTGGMTCTIPRFILPFVCLTVSQTIWIGIMGIVSTIVYISKQFPRQIRLLLLNLSVVDIISSVLTGILDSNGYLSSTSQTSSMKLQIFLIEFRLTAHMLSITVMTLDRIMSLVFAMKYQIHIKDKKMIAVCCVIWVSAFATVTGALYDMFARDTDVLFTSDSRYDRYYILVGTKSFLLLSNVLGYIIMCVYVKTTKYLAGHLVPSFQTESTTRILHNALLHSAFYLLDLVGSMYVIHSCTCILLMITTYRVLVYLSYCTSVILLIVQGRECRLLIAIVLCSCHKGWSEHLNRIRNELYAPYLKSESQSTSTGNVSDVRDIDGLDFSFTETSTPFDMISLPTIHTNGGRLPEIRNHKLYTSRELKFK